MHITYHYSSTTSTTHYQPVIYQHATGTTTYQHTTGQAVSTYQHGQQ